MYEYWLFTTKIIEEIKSRVGSWQAIEIKEMFVHFSVNKN